jgi:4-amino-4-deoxy-L-arabinose transferase-like glycosyltransferase
MGSVDALPLDEAMEHPDRRDEGNAVQDSQGHFRYELIVVLVSAVVFLVCAIGPPSLMDDVDAVHAQIARNMLDSGDWVTAHLDGVAYLEKSPLRDWAMAVSYMIFGVHDWAARIPMALFTIALCWLTARIGWWAFGGRAGLYAGLALATCAGLFLFTRVLIPDVALTFTVTLAMWAFLRALEDDEPHPCRWAWIMAVSIATGLLVKGLIAVVLPAGAGLAYLLLTRQLFQRRTWKRLRPFSGTLIMLLIAAPWHVLATIRNPPYFYFSMRSVPGEYHGFFWFYFINEHLLRFLNLRYPRDYDTVPRLYFWLFNLLWLFPWSAYLAAAFRLSYRNVDRAGRMRLLALCWIGFLLVFFTFSSTQEYYSMPCYPALALLIGYALTQQKWIRAGDRVISAIAVLAALAIGVILVQVWNLPTPGDISTALTEHPEAYTRSLGHMGDLTLKSFAYLRLPLILAGIAFLIGASAVWWRQPIVAFVVMMVLFLHSARIAMVVFDPYLSSRPLAYALMKAPPGQLIEDNAYYTFSSVFFYANRRGLLLNGRQTNLEYGSYAPKAPDVFIDDAGFARLWRMPDRYYLLVEGPSVPRIELLVGQPELHVVAESGGKYLLTNHANSD